MAVGPFSQGKKSTTEKRRCYRIFSVSSFVSSGQPHRTYEGKMRQLAENCHEWSKDNELVGFLWYGATAAVIHRLRNSLLFEWPLANMIVSK